MVEERRCEGYFFLECTTVFIAETIHQGLRYSWTAETADGALSGLRAILDNPNFGIPEPISASVAPSLNRNDEQNDADMVEADMQALERSEQSEIVNSLDDALEDVPGLECSGLGSEALPECYQQ